MDKKYLELALDNIIKFGDTGIFPFPFEKYIFYDKKQEVINHLTNIDNNFANYLNLNPPVNINTCSPVGYTGFRWATQIDPIWNAYFLALVISISDSIEKERVSTEKRIVHSYRFKPNYSDGLLFDNEINWQTFQRQSLEVVKATKSEFIISCDIADFYSRIYHHRLDNSLLGLNTSGDTPKKIMDILQKFSGTNSYGIPIGGPASRILAELALNNIDRILIMQGIKFTRYVDDIHLFAKTQEEAHAYLNFLAIKLMSNEGLALQKHKTQILTKTEFFNIVASRLNADSDDADTNYRARFMALPVRYDPYSATASVDYEKIKSELEEFDILGLLNEELRKTRIHQQFSKHILKAFNHLDETIVSQAFTSISDRLDLLYPIFPSVMMAASANYDKLSKDAQHALITKLQDLVKKDNYIIQIDLNVAYLVRVLGKDYSPENEEILGSIYRKFSTSILVRSWILQVFANWKLKYWLSDMRASFPTMTKWERRVFILASYFMQDEGRHWRDHNKRGFTEFETIIRDWASQKVNQINWAVPL